MSHSNPQPQPDDFICNRDNVLWLLQQSAFYKECPVFERLQPLALQLSAFISANTKDDGCGGCAAVRARSGQAQLLDNFVRLFLHYYDAGKLEELQMIRDFVLRRQRPCGRILLAYSGKATKDQNRFVVVE